MCPDCNVEEDDSISTVLDCGPLRTLASESSTTVHFEEDEGNHFDMPPDCSKTWKLCLTTQMGQEIPLPSSESSVQETCITRLTTSQCKFHQLGTSGLNLRRKIIQHKFSVSQRIQNIPPCLLEALKINIDFHSET